MLYSPQDVASDLDLSCTVRITTETESCFETQPDETTVELRSSPHYVVHKHLLISSSEFFRNALATASWKEGDEGLCKLSASTEVLQIFVHWLYFGMPDATLSCSTLVYLTIFASVHVIDALTENCLESLQTSLRQRLWTPSVTEISQVFQEVPEISPLRGFMVMALARNKSFEEKELILNDAPAAFVRDYALHLSKEDRQELKQPDYYYWTVPSEGPKSTRLDYERTIKFQLSNATPPAIIHSSILVDADACATDQLSDGTVWSTQTVDSSIFAVFGWWLYSRRDSSLLDMRQPTLNPPKLFDCYRLAMLLSEAVVEDADEVLNESVRRQGSHFRRFVLKAISIYYRGCDDLVTSSEVDAAYAITSAGDPLRELLGELSIAKGRLSVIGVPNREFQGELNASLLGRLKRLQGYVAEVELVLGPYKMVKESASGAKGRSRKRHDLDYEGSVRDINVLTDIEAPDLLELSTK